MKVMKTNRRTNNISPASAERMLNFLNRMRRAEEIVEAVNTLTGNKDFTIKAAQRILEKQRQLRGFKDVKEVSAIPSVGAKRFALILSAAMKTSRFY
jgi:hypothetical protein